MQLSDKLPLASDCSLEMTDSFYGRHTQQDSVTSALGLTTWGCTAPRPPSGARPLRLCLRLLCRLGDLGDRCAVAESGCCEPWWEVTPADGVAGGADLCRPLFRAKGIVVSSISGKWSCIL